VPASTAKSDLSALAGLFYPSLAALGSFDEVDVEELPPAYRQLLAHQHHMTVTVEEFHHSPVDVKVLEAKTSGGEYSRKILLTRRTDGQVVQFGIVRLKFEFLSEDVWREIEGQSTPLGRVLIEHNVLREIELLALWRVKPGDDLRRGLGIAADKITYGRTAIIHCDRQPAVELLEIVAPVD
jgi:chorismate-pyruvate lyase